MFFSAVPNFDVRRTGICVHTRTGPNLPFLFFGGYPKGPSSAVEAAVTLNVRPQQQIANKGLPIAPHARMGELLPKIVGGPRLRCQLNLVAPTDFVSD